MVVVLFTDFCFPKKCLTEKGLGLVLSFLHLYSNECLLPDKLYLTNQSVLWGWTLNLSLSKHNLTYQNLELTKPETLNS